MDITNLEIRHGLGEDKKLDKAIIQFNNLLSELRKRDLPSDIVEPINSYIEELNGLPLPGKKLRKQIRKKLTAILKLIEKELKLVPKNHYRNIWIGIGLAVFGTPIGVAIGASLGNMGFIGVGFAFGIPIGMIVGSMMDKKALQEGKQLDWELK